MLSFHYKQGMVYPLLILIDKTGFVIYDLSEELVPRHIILENEVIALDEMLTKIKEYFDTTDLNKRKIKMQELVDAYGDEIKDYRTVHELRYAVRKDKNIKDYFLRGWILLYGFKNGVNLKPSKMNDRMFQEVRECLCLSEYETASDEQKGIFYKEYVNMTEFYIETALRDRSYGSSFLGVMRLSEDKIKTKLAMEIFAISFFVPRKLGKYDEMEAVRSAMCEGFKKRFPDDYDILEKIIHDNKNK